ncbi:MAG: DGQHR domain-containing protein [Terriglobales bacterium]
MAAQKTAESIQTISVIVPANPFIPRGGEVKHCLAALDVAKLMEWWPGTPHAPHRNPEKVRAIQRSLDWKRVAQIAAYLLQREIVDVPKRVVQYFGEIYGPKAGEPGREWPPRLPNVARFQRSAYPTFSNVLLHVNGATIEELSGNSSSAQGETAKLVFNENDKGLNFSVIDGQHRINGAYLAVCISRTEKQSANWEIPSEIFLDLDMPGSPPRRQAQIFIDVNAYQKKVDRSLVADLFPTARGRREPLDDKERAQDIGRRLMLEIGPLVGMIQIPGIRYGVKDVVTLATLNSAIEDILGDMYGAGLESLDSQTEFLAVCLEAWLEATGRREDIRGDSLLSAENVAYQGRAIVSFLTLIPACILELRRAPKTLFVSNVATATLTTFLRSVMKRAGLLSGGKFLSKNQFRIKGYLGSGGLARFRDCLWAAVGGTKVTSRVKPERISEYASESRARVRRGLESTNDD